MPSDRRHDFYSTDGVTYLNCAYMGPMPRLAIEAVRAALRLKMTPHLVADRHFFTFPEAYRSAVARLLAVPAERIAVTDSTTSGIMLVVNGLDWRPGDRVLLPAASFPANRFPWHWLARRGVEVVEVPEDDESLSDAERFAAAWAPRTRVLAAGWVSYRTGRRRDLAGLGELCRARGALFVVDGTQGVGGLALDLAATPCDLLACSGYKWMLGPYGTGFAYLTPALAEQLEPHNVNWFRIAGAEDFNRLAERSLDLVPGASRFDRNAPAAFFDIAGAAAAAEYLAEVTPRAVEEHVRGLLDRLLAGLPPCFRPAGPLSPGRRSNILCIAAASEEATRAAFARLRQGGVVASLREGAIRLSPGIYNTEADIDRVLALL
jgi:selenocysteine lyase/cysteine desulfurase